MRGVIKIGLTGNIGSGKSLISKALYSMGYAIFNSDLAGKEVLHKNEDVRKKIVDKWGNKVLSGENLDRTKIAEVVFSDENELAFLNSLIHPKVQDLWNEFLVKNKDKMVFKEAAILIESGSYKDCDEVILVTCPIEERIRRVVNRDKVSPESVLKRMARQWPEEKLKNFASYSIVNDGYQLIIPQLIAILDQLNKKCA